MTSLQKLTPISPANSDGGQSSGAGTGGGPFTLARVKEVSMQHPILRSVLCPSEDVTARSQCVDLLWRVVEAAEVAQHPDHANANVPPEIVSQWKRLQEQDNIRQAESPGKSAGSRRRSFHAALGEVSAGALRAKLASYLEMLRELSDSHDSVMAKVFWEYWDHIIPNLVELAPKWMLVSVHRGRLFQPGGDAAVLLRETSSPVFAPSVSMQVSAARSPSPPSESPFTDDQSLVAPFMWAGALDNSVAMTPQLSTLNAKSQHPIEFEGLVKSFLRGEGEYEEFN